jgi:hypothetical protein
VLKAFILTRDFIESLGVYTTSRSNGRSNSVAYLPLNEISPISETIISKLEAQDPQAVFPSNTDPAVIEGWKAQHGLLIKYTRQDQLGNIEFIGGPIPGFGLVLAKPFSRGSLSINSTDPFNDSVVDFGTFRNPLDVDIFIEMIGAWRRMLTTESYKFMGPTAVNPPSNMTSTADLEQYLRTTVTSSVYHPAGSAAMMRKELGGVVRSDLLVYGTKKLSVIDSSILPIVPSAHLTAVMYAVAEKVSRFCFTLLLHSTVLASFDCLFLTLYIYYISFRLRTSSRGVMAINSLKR